jgi:uncharacterized protein YjiS (DUF1127 family)
MAFLTETHNASFADRFLAAFSPMATAVSNYIQYRKTVKELSKLTNRELGDLGLSRNGIKASALYAVYNH